MQKHVDIQGALPCLQNFVEKMPTVAFHIENHHGRPHWSNDGHFQPSHLVSVDDISDVAPQVVIAETHVDNMGTVTVKSAVTVVTQRNTAIATQSIACLCASLASSNVFRTTNDTIFSLIQLLTVTTPIHMQGALPFVIAVLQFRAVLPRCS